MNEDEVRRTILSLEDNRSTGYDITDNILKKTVDFKFSQVQLMSLLSSDALKKSIITPIYKSRDRLLCSNYRLILVLPLLSKIFEKIPDTRFIQRKYKPLSNNQYGFRAGRSTEVAIAHLTSS